MEQGIPIPDDAYAQYQVGFMYMTGYGVQKNLEEGLKWLRRSAHGATPCKKSIEQLESRKSLIHRKIRE